MSKKLILNFDEDKLIGLRPFHYGTLTMKFDVDFDLNREHLREVMGAVIRVTYRGKVRLYIFDRIEASEDSYPGGSVPTMCLVFKVYATESKS